jgi:PilZ domain
MLADGFFEDFEWSDWTPYIGPAVGVLAAIVVLLVGWMAARRRSAGSPAGAVPPPALRDKSTMAGTPVEPAAADPFVQGTNRERRGALRRGGNPVAILISNADAQTEPSHGWVVDRSTGGLCLSVPEAVPEGTVLSVRTTNAPTTVPWVQIEVKNCRLVGKEYELGCRFVRTPPWSVMLLFG